MPTYTFPLPWNHSKEGRSSSKLFLRSTPLTLPTNRNTYILPHYGKQPAGARFSSGKPFSSAPQENDSHFFTRTHTTSDDHSWGSSTSLRKSLHSSSNQSVSLGSRSDGCGILFAQLLFPLRFSSPAMAIQFNKHVPALIPLTINRKHTEPIRNW